MRAISFFSRILSYGALIQVKIPLNPCVFELGRGGTSKLAKVLKHKEYTEQNGTGTLSDITGGGRSPFFFVDSRASRTPKHPTVKPELRPLRH